MSINDFLEMDLIPILIIVFIIGAFFALYYTYKMKRVKSIFENESETSVTNVKVIAKEKGEKITVGGTIAKPIKGYLCTIVFEKDDGSRLVLKTTQSIIYDMIIIGDLANIKYKQESLTEYHAIK